MLAAGGGARVEVGGDWEEGSDGVMVFGGKCVEGCDGFVAVEGIAFIAKQELDL